MALYTKNQVAAFHSALVMLNATTSRPRPNSVLVEITLKDKHGHSVTVLGNKGGYFTSPPLSREQSMSIRISARTRWAVGELTEAYKAALARVEAAQNATPTPTGSITDTPRPIS